MSPEEILRRLELTVTHKLDGLLHGEHQGLRPGPGTEPGEARLYQPGDDVRHMDWAVTARTNEPTCACRSPSASWRRGSWPTSRPASTSGRRAARSATSPSTASPPSASSRPRSAT